MACETCNVLLAEYKRLVHIFVDEVLKTQGAVGPKQFAVSVRGRDRNLDWMVILADLSQFAVIPQAKYLKTGEAEAKVFTTAKAGWRARFLEVQGCVAP